MKYFQLAVASIVALAQFAGPLTSVQAQTAPDTKPAEILTNDTILKLIAVGLPEQAIVAKIQASKSAFDVSTDRLIELQTKGVSGPILAAMLQPVTAAPLEFSTDSPDANIPHYPGVYMLGIDENRMTRMMATSSNQAKTGGILGYALTAGIASLSVKAAIPGKSAKVQTRNPRPIFYLFFDESVPRAMQTAANSIWTSGNGSITTSPAELSLVKFVQKSAAREARVGSVNIAGAKQGVMDKDQVAFDVELVRPGVFKVVPKFDLVAGEYGFIQALAGGNVSGGGGAMTARVFDFGVVQ